MNRCLLSFVLLTSALGAMPCPAQQGPSKDLFNGKDLTGWHTDVPDADSNPNIAKSFVVRNGMLVSLGEPRGHLITDASYGNYRLEVEYRFPGKPGNAGVLVHSSTPRALYEMFPKSLEVQMEHGNAGDFWVIREDIKVPDMERRRGPRKDWGTTEEKERHILNLTDSSEKPLGEWNTMVIEAVDRSIRVWVNGDLVNDGSEATVDHGQIALQAEGSEVEFRKLLLTPISKLTNGSLPAALKVTPLVEKNVVALPAGPLFWRVENYPTLEQAHAAAKEWSLATEADGKAWLFTLGPSGGTSPGARKVADVGPIAPVSAGRYLLRINEAKGPPGSVTPVHSHPGSEAFFVLKGEQSIRSPHGVMRVQAGQPEAGHGADMAMQVSSSGSADLLSLVMFVVDAKRPFSSPATLPVSFAQQ